MNSEKSLEAVRKNLLHYHREVTREKMKMESKQLSTPLRQVEKQIDVAFGKLIGLDMAINFVECELEGNTFVFPVESP